MLSKFGKALEQTKIQTPNAYMTHLVSSDLRAAKWSVVINIAYM